MVTLGEYEPGSLKILLVGPSGSGKTCLATTLGRRCTVLDLNNGLSSAKLFQDRFTAERLLCEPKKCWGGGPGTMWQKTVSYINSFIARPETDALVIDGLSDLAEASLGSVLETAGNWSDEQPKNTTMSQWGTAISQVSRVMWKLKSIPRLVIMIAHTKTVERDGKEMEVVGCYGKQLPDKIAAIFDEVWYTHITGDGKEKKFTLQSVSSGSIQCKTRRQLPDNSSMDLGMGGLLQLVGWKWPDEVAAAGKEKK